MAIISKIANIIIRGYKKSFDPTGRDNRLQYFSIVLFQVMLFFIYLDLFSSEDNEIALSVFIILFLPLLSSNIRRLHDAGYSAIVWFVVPFLVLAICIFLKSEPVKNKYGDPEI
jgi:uncharacterized membrane protein YhaH (DUF805 family)